MTATDYTAAFTDTDDTPPLQPLQPVPPVTDGAALLDEVARWFRRYVFTISDAEHDLLALWTAHSHLAVECYTTPRLQLDSPIPGSGKTTVLEHLARLCHHPVTMASVSSPALLTRMLDKGIRTILIDEVDRSLNPDKDGVSELLAVLNSGYKRGATRPVLVPVKGGGWEPAEMPTFAPVALAGNNPSLPDDTRTRIIRVLLLPDLDGTADESDWELIEGDAADLAARLAAWCEQIRDQIRASRPTMPDRIIGRFREKWQPLRRIADAAGGRWPAAVNAMALADREQYDMDKEDGLIREQPALMLLRHLHHVWPAGREFVPTTDLIALLVEQYPTDWGERGPFGKPLTAHRMGRMLATAYKVNSTRLGGVPPRGYTAGSLATPWRQLRIGTPPHTSGGSGGNGGTGGTPPLSPLPPLPPDAPDDTPEPAARCWCGQYADDNDPDGFCGADDPEHDEARAAAAT